MSYAILELNLCEPPCTIERVRMAAGVMWRTRCGRCNAVSGRHLLISNAVLAFEKHADEHVSHDETDLTSQFSTTRKPLEIMAVA